MIAKPGTVTITEGYVWAEGFHFTGVNSEEAGRQALKWAADRIAEELAKPKVFPPAIELNLRA